jgi:superfamily II DNA or RNA helicase
MAAGSNENRYVCSWKSYNKLTEKGLVLKREQTLAIECLLEGRDVLVVLPTGFGKSFLLAEDIRRVCSSTTSILIIVSLRSIIDEQLRSNDFAVRIIASGNINSAVLIYSGIKENNFQIVYASADEALSLCLLNLLPCWRRKARHSETNCLS